MGLQLRLPSQCHHRLAAERRLPLSLGEDRHLASGRVRVRVTTRVRAGVGVGVRVRLRVGVRVRP